MTNIKTFKRNVCFMTNERIGNGWGTDEEHMVMVKEHRLDCKRMAALWRTDGGRMADGDSDQTANR